VKSSLALGALPSATGIVSWLPMHAVAQALFDVALSTVTQPALNIVHPRPVAWNSIITAVNDALVQEDILKESLPVVDFSKWFDLLEAKAREDSSTQHIINVVRLVHIFVIRSGEADIFYQPAIKLIEFFRMIARVDQVAHQRGQEDGEVGGQATFSTEKVQTISATMRQLPRLGKEDAGLWVKYWKGVGLFGR
jgi:hypothetical protein